MTDVQPIPVYRPPFLTDGGEFRGQLVEAPSNVFFQQVKASRATLNRMQFQWRSVSDNLLLSPTVMLRFKLKVTSMQVWNQICAYVSVHGIAGSVDTQANAETYTANAGGANQATSLNSMKVPCIVFADGDAFSSVCSSMNLVFNGTSISLNRCNRFWRDYLRTQVACDDVARIYKASGGSYDKYDQTPVVVAKSGGNDANMGSDAVGITQDSGISERSKALFAQSEPDQSDGFSRIVQVSYPVPLPPFNPWRGYALPASCPYKNCPLAIPHLSAGQLDFLLEDFEKGFLRRLGSTIAAGGAQIRTNGSPADLGIQLDTTSDCYVELKYFRLSHTRALKESYRFNIWQAQTFLGKAPPTDATSGHRQFGDLIAMDPVGKDLATVTLRSGSQISYAKTNKTWSFEFDTINLAQIPSFLLISCPKLGDTYSLAIDGREDQGQSVIPNAVRNLSHNLYIKQIRIIVNSARGAIEKSMDVDSGFIDAERLWEMTKENANSRYFAEGGFRAWRDHGCAILLASTQFAPGLQACDGVAYPVQIQIEMVVENRSVDVSALTCARNGGVNAAAFAGHGNKRVHKLQPDYIRAQAQCTAFYQRVVLATTETAATVNAMNYPLASAERLMNAAGQMR